MTLLDDPGPSLTKIQMVIRFSNGDEDMWLSMDEESTVGELKERLRKLRWETLSGRRIQLIYLGKILKNDSMLLEVLNKRPIKQSDVLLHCNVSDLMDSVMDEERNDSLNLSIRPLPLGFDRLRDVGFSEREIALLREQFRLIHGQDSIYDDPEAPWQLEEDWINQTAPEHTGQDGYGAYEDMILGTSIGFLGVNFQLEIGIFVLFFVWEPKIFPRRRQMAIIAGVMINLFFGFLRLQ
ncbi:hypothetical protein PCK2_000883 [Pneumocystis canis]|nr:hypothetical protein PCK2_000883 [Pneumocystis canis]